MANTQCIPTQTKVDILNGLHALGTTVVRGATTKDAYKAALYFASASRGAGDTVYNTTGEATGSGYTAGGISVTNATAPTSSGTTAFWTPSASLAFGTISITAFDCVLIYNDTSSTKLVLSIHTFSSQTIVAGAFTLTMPTNDATNGLVRIA